METLKTKIRHVPDFPKPGILFYDITTLLRDPEGSATSIDALASSVRGQGHRPRRGHREPRLHPRRRRWPTASAPGSCRPQAGQASVEDARGRATRSSTAPTRSRCTTTP